MTDFNSGRSDVTSEELFNSSTNRTIQEEKLSDNVEYSREVTATVAEINAGKVVLPEVSGASYIVTDIDIVCAGNAAGATALTLVSTEDAPKTLITVPVADATNNAIITTRPLTANVTTGTGFRAALTAGKGVNVAKTGSTLTGTTSVTVHVKYRIIA